MRTWPLFTGTDKRLLPETPNHGVMPIMNLVFASLLFFITLMPAAVEAATYANAATTYNWIDSSTHTRVTAASTPYKFRNPGGCATTPPIIDDTISDQIMIGFNFTYGDKSFDSIRIMSNGRIHLTSTSIPYDNTNCGYGGPVTYWAYANTNLNYTMRIYGADLDPTTKADAAAIGYTTSCQDGTSPNNNPCYVSFASIGSAPNRQFVVTWKGVPEWTSFSNATGAYNVQLILNEDGTFIYQYGSNVPGPSNSTAQVGWQVSTTNFDALNVGYPVQGTAIKYFVPHPVAEYLMEQTSWSGSAPVLDTSGNALHATLVGSIVGSTLPALTASGKVCKGALFTGVAGQAISSGLSVPTGIGNTGTIAFWYKSSTALNWNNSSNVDEVLLDATTSSGQWFYLVKRGGANAGKLRFVITDSLGTARVAETGALSVASGTWKHIAVTWSFNNYVTTPNDHLRIYVDAGTPTATNFTSTTLTISPGINTLYVGGTRNSIADTTVSPSLGIGSAKGTIDEFRSYNYEASRATISSMMSMNSGGCIDHYSITNSATGLSCQLSQVTVAAHTVTHANYINNNLVNLTSDGTGSWVRLTGFGTLTNTGSGQATYLFNNESSALLGYIHPTAGTVTFHANDGSKVDSENTALAITACSPGRFNACEVTSPRCTPTLGSTSYANLYTKLANTPFSIDLVAVKVDGTIETTYTPLPPRTVTIKLLANTTPPTINPSTNCPASQAATVLLGAQTFTLGRGPTGGVSVAANAFSIVSPNLSAYRDVRVQFVCSSPSCTPALTTCATDGFSIRPQSFTVTSSANADSTGSSATATPTVKSDSTAHSGGTTFTISANTATPGYDGLPGINVAKAIWASAPAGGREYVLNDPVKTGAGNLAGAFTTSATLTTGNGVSGSNFTYDEVGYFALQAGGVDDSNFTAVSGDQGNGDCDNTRIPLSNNNTEIGGKYGCKIINLLQTNHFGRFIPDHFSVVTPVPFTAGCSSGGFSYMDQPFSTPLAASIEARNGGDGKTQNYSGSSFGKATVNLKMENNNSGTAITNARLSGLGTPSWSNGAYAFTATQFSRLAANVLDGPYDALDVGVQLTDSDSVVLVNRDMDASNTSCTADPTGTSSGTCTAKKLVTTKMRYGRLRLANAFGAEQLPLAVPTLTEYWNGLRWLKNMDDSCTSFNIPTTGNSGLILALTSGTSSASMADGTVSGSCTTGTCTFYKGDGRLVLSAPGAGKTGYVDITLTPPGWLLYSGMNQNTTARASFGFYNQSGNARKIIYRREVR
jgi:MSHA biogenesis protein MshQ